MDNPDSTPVSRSWAPAIRLVVVGWVVSVAMAGWGVVVADPAGRLLSVLAALAIGGLALFGTLARPRLAASQEGIVVTGITGSRRWPWSDVQRMRVTRFRRLGRELPMLELDVLETGDLGERLIVFGRMELNADPVDVLDELNAARG